MRRALRCKGGKGNIDEEEKAEKERARGESYEKSGRRRVGLKGCGVSNLARNCRGHYARSRGEGND